ncbi:DUF2232 domain-containing protein [Cellulosilyticum sp. I15G10I2]|uniref:DUF2232 domain-containing protein n=1 Tax=Cellulosilyticum sp. I15G10I2 TaxID=1892843 RepID=UPI00085C5F64|nr:DUF2232 domain-containing protein [Cellulosilyticum sp. I15G10I2]
MKQNSKSIIFILMMMLVYVLLARLGIYHTGGIILFPILSAPLAVYLIKKQLTQGVDFLFNIAIIIGIYLLTNSVQSVLIYIISVSIPAYAAAFFYKKEVPLPNMIMYVSISVAGAIFIYLGVMKSLGIDYEAQFILLVDEIKGVYFNVLETIARPASTENILEQSIMKELITAITDTIKKVYPALILTAGVFLSSIQVILLNIVLRSKGTKLLSLKQLFNFKLSKIAVLILFIAMIIPLSRNQVNDITSILSLNVLFFLQNLMQVMGIISIIVLLRRATVHNAFKVLGYMILFILLIMPTNILMMFGCFDTLFNYRKAQIIV